MKYQKPILIISIFTALMLLNGAVAIEDSDITLESPDAIDSMDKPYNKSDFKNNISESEDEFLNHANSHPINQNYSSINWLVEDEKTQLDEKDEQENEETSEPDESEEDSGQGSSSSSSSSGLGTGTSTSTDRSWLKLSANLSTNSADYNETVYINGEVESNEERKVSVFLGNERISQVGPLNGSFRVPVEASEVNDRELRMKSDYRTMTFDLEVDSKTDLSELDSEDENNCINASSNRILGFNNHNSLEIFGDHDSKPCLNSSISSTAYEPDERPDNSSQSISQSFTGMFSQRATGEDLFAEIRDRIDRAQQEIGLMLDSIWD